MNRSSGDRFDAMHAFFIDTPGKGRRFCVHHPAQGASVKGKILYLPPFAEELNKARRMTAIQSLAFAKAGYEVLQLDPLGCGDSSGDFSDASWDEWLSDVALGAAWLAQGRPAPLWLWGLRASCLLVSEAAQRHAIACNFLFWQPATQGKTVLQQFLRIKVAAEALGGQTKGGAESLRAALAQGQAVEVAGYALPGALAQGLERARLTPPPVLDGRTPRMEWMELSTQADAALTPVAEAGLQAWQAATYQARAHTVQGPGFWASTEIEVAPALIDASLHAISEVTA